MFRRSTIPPQAVHATMRRHLLVDGYPIVVDLEHSRGSRVRDQISGDDYLDFFSFFASNPIGMNHPSMLDDEMRERLGRTAIAKVSNADYYTTYLAEFVDTLEKTAAPSELPHYFFIEGGALGVENAMKIAFDWKVRKNLANGRSGHGTQIMHLENAFHGRSGYTLSVTNTDPVKTAHFPKFDWPRLPCPALSFPVDQRALTHVQKLEEQAIDAAERYFDTRPYDVAAILIEPIQGEGGDNHFRPEFLRELRRICDERDALLVFDEVQTGLGLTGKWWAYQHFGVEPDILCFGKKMQLGGVFASLRIDDVPDNVFVVPSRISSTWAGNLVDMVRATRILEIIVNEKLLDNAAARGKELLDGLERLVARFTGIASNARGLGLMCAIDMPSSEFRTRVVRRCFEDKMIVLPCGSRSIRFRPALTVDAEIVAEGLNKLEKAIDEILSHRPVSAEGPTTGD